FMAAFPALGLAVQANGWRSAWSEVGLALVLVAPLFALFVRSTPEACGLEVDGEAAPAIGHGTAATPDRRETVDGPPPGEGLGTPAFWVVAASGAVYGLVASGIALFNESILAERGFDATTYYRTLVVTALTALVGNFAGGAVAARGSIRRLLAVSLGLLALSLAALPHLPSPAHVVAYAVVMGLAGGFVIVVFFTFWGKAYGRAHLGRIQGAAQILTVLASAVGPLVLAQCVTRTGSYAPAFYTLASVAAVLAVAAMLVRVPVRSPR